MPLGTGLAGNDDEIFLGNDAALVGGAVTATTVSGSALWYNPAGIAGAPFDSVDLSASAATVRWVSITGFLSAPTGEEAAGDYTELLIVPSALTFTRRMGEEWALAAGVFVPRFNEVRIKFNSRRSGDAAHPVDDRDERHSSALPFCCWGGMANNEDTSSRRDVSCCVRARI